MPDPTLIIAGNPGAIEMPIRTVWRKTGGYSYERRWWGPANAVRALQADPNFLSAFPSATDIQFDQREGSPVGILSIQLSGIIGENDDIATETVTISFKDEPFPIHQNPTFVEILPEGLRIMEELLDAKTANPYTTGPTPVEIMYRKYYDLRLEGIDNYRAKLPYVSWSRIVGSNYPVALDLAGVGAIYSTGSLAGSIGAPVLFSIPTGNVGISASASGRFKVGWLKDGSVDYTGDGKLQLILTAEYGLWANDLYNFIT